MYYMPEGGEITLDFFIIFFLVCVLFLYSFFILLLGLTVSMEIRRSFPL
jgi:hypothetical protein